MPTDLNPEQRARRRIDGQMAEAGWAVQGREEINLAAARGVVVREFRLAPGHGVVDYRLAEPNPGKDQARCRFAI